MKQGQIEVDQLCALLRRPASDPIVLDFIGETSSIKRAADQGYAEFKRIGVSVMFKEARLVLPRAEITDPRMLIVSAIHLHRKKHEGYSEYQGHLPNGLVFGDREADVIRKMGEPEGKGGGGISTVLHRPIPRWLRYSLDDSLFHLQLDVNSRVEMVTIYPPPASP
jgi:hypothetical protein